jgi:hypothetical protein
MEQRLATIYPDTLNECPLLEAKRTLVGLSEMSAYDPKRTFPTNLAWSI